MTGNGICMAWRGRLGVPYQGSKNQIAREIISILPGGKRFVDLFAGGCAMTHAALISGKYETVLANDLHGFGLRLFVDAIAGKCDGRWKEWVSPDDFASRRSDDPLVALCWSYGSTMTQYVYGRGIVDAKRAAHERAVEIGYDRWIAEHRGATNKGDDFRQLEAMYRVMSLDRLRRLSPYTEAMEHTFCDYRDYRHEDGDVVYCDPPYAMRRDDGYVTFGRNVVFDSRSFWDWVESRDYPVFVSEYSAPEGFSAVWEKRKVGLMKKNREGGYSAHVERVYVARRYADLVPRMDLFGNCQIH